MLVARTPVEKEVQGFLNFISRGNFKKDYKKKYDDLFHLYLVLQLEKDGKKLYAITEKTPNISWDIKNTYAIREKGNQKKDYVELNVTKPNLKIGDAIELAKSNMGDKFENYDSINNCQKYVSGIVGAIYQLSNAPYVGQIKNFIEQDVEEILNANPIVKHTANVVTKIAHKFGKIFLGKGRIYI
jgi:hypothetical protein